MTKAQHPFFFMAASPLLRICGERASTLGELLEGVRRVNDSSIFTHTFQTVEKHHFLTEGFSNDFAHWALSALNEHRLAEQLEALDIRKYATLGQLRQDVIGTIEKYLEETPDNKDRQAFEPFYFCESRILAVPSKLMADDLDTFVGCLRCVSLRSISYHFIGSRLRSPAAANDFSRWLETSLGLGELARRVDAIDIYTNTLEGVREQIVKEVDSWPEK